MNPYLLVIKQKANSILSFLAGEVCLSCETKLGFICDSCLSELPYLKNNICNVCATPMSSVDNLVCGTCLKFPPAFNRIVSFYIYEGVIRKIIQEAKFNKKTFYFSKLLNIIDNDIKRVIPSSYTAIVPIPVSKRRLLERGYNQSLIIAKRLSKILKIPILDDCLVKVKDTPPQTRFGKEERFKNIKDVFFLKKNINSDKVIIVDDIVTTTATVREAAKVLKVGGVNEIIVFSLSRAKD